MYIVVVRIFGQTDEQGAKGLDHVGPFDTEDFAQFLG